MRAPSPDRRTGVVGSPPRRRRLVGPRSPAGQPAIEFLVFVLSLPLPRTTIRRWQLGVTKATTRRDIALETAEVGHAVVLIAYVSLYAVNRHATAKVLVAVSIRASLGREECVVAVRSPL